MRLWDRLVGDTPVETLELLPPAGEDVLVSRLKPSRIKYGGILVVAPGQCAALSYRNQVADVFPAGRHSLTPETLPRLVALLAFGPVGTPFRAEVDFVSSRHFTVQNWSTPAPITIKDEDYGALRIRANGTFQFAVTDISLFVRELSATIPDLTQFRLPEFHNLLVGHISEIVRTGEVSTSDLLGNRGMLGLLLGEHLAREMSKIGVTITRFTVGSVTVPPENQKLLGAKLRGSPASSSVGGDGYTAKLPTAPEVEVLPPQPPKPKPVPAEAKQFIDSLLQSTGHSGPKSTRIPLVDAAPLFPAPRAPASGPKSERLMLGDLANADENLPASGSSIPNHNAGVGRPAPTEVMPPPLPHSLEFFVGLNGVPAGPFDLITISAKIREGMISRKMLVWKPGMESWSAADTVPELRSLFLNTPPPLPQ